MEKGGVGGPRHPLVLGKLIVRVNAVPVDVIGVNGVTSDSVSQGDAPLD
jgi:hypothetical protein